MSDPRIEKLAQVLVHYSLGVKKGMWVRLDGSTVAAPLLTAAYVEVLKAGGFPMVRAGLPGLGYLGMKHASEEQLRFVSPTAKLEVQKLDAVLTVWADTNTKEMTTVDPKRIAMTRVANRPLMEKMLARLAAGTMHWCGTLFPNAAAAQDAEMSLHEYEEFVYGAGFLHKKDPIAEWKSISTRQAKMVVALGELSTIRIVGLDTDLTFRVAGRKWINCDGHENFPDGEIFTGPIENSAEGKIRYTFPAVYHGKEVRDVRLVFKKGKVVEAHADKGGEFLHSMLDSDPGARRVGELAFGTNYGIRNFTKNTLFDEKIGGTLHIALGASLPESGGKNKSALHWDMVCDTRRGFTVYGDGKPVMKDGKWLL